MTSPSDLEKDEARLRQTRRQVGRHAKRFGAWSISLMLGLIFVALFAALALTGKPISLPNWVQSNIETRLEQALGGADVSFGHMEAVVQEGGRPSVRVRDVAVMDEQGTVLLNLADVQASLAMRPLLRGEVQPKGIVLNGAIAQLRRASDGAFSVSLGAAQGTREAASLPELIQQLDGVFAVPAMAALNKVELRGLSLRFEDARVNRAWSIDGGRVELTRNGDDIRITSDLALLGGGASVSTVSLNYASQIGSLASEFGAVLTDVPASDMATQGAAFAWMDVLRAPISGAVRSGTDTDGKLSPLNATLQISKGVLQPSETAKPIPFNLVRSYFTYTAAKDELRFSELYVDSAWVKTRLEGAALLGGLRKTGRLTDLTGELAASALVVNPAGAYPEPVTLDGASLQFRVGFDPFKVEIGQALVMDQGEVLNVSGRVDDTQNGWSVAVDGRMDAITPERLMTLWPQAAVPKTRDWLEKNLLKADLSALDIAVRIVPEQPVATHLAFAYTDATVKFAKTMPVMSGASGTASLMENRFVLIANEGTVTPEEGGAIDVSGTSFIIPDVSIKGGAPAVAKLVLDGSITSMLSILDRPPLSVMRNANLPVALSKGRAQLTGTLALSLDGAAKPEDLKYAATGRLLDVETSQLVQGRVLTADALDLRLDNASVQLSGDARLDEVPLIARWVQPLGQGGAGSRVTGDIELSPNTLKTFGVALPSGFVSGRGRADFDVALGQAAPRLSLSSNLRGIGLNIATLGWSKPAAAPGQFQLQATLGPKPDITSISLSGNGLGAEGKITLTDGGALSRARFDRVQVGDWLSARVDLIGRGRNQPAALQVTGGTLDLRRATLGAGEGGSDGGPLTLLLDRLQISDTIALTDFQGQFATNGGLNGSFSGKLNGAAPVEGKMVPQNGRSAIRIQSQNAGAVFAASGLLKQARGGLFDLTLTPSGDEGTFEGVLFVKDIRVIDAPAIAALLNAASIVGLLDELQGRGISFNSAEAKFRLTPSLLVLREASATGPSMGLSMDGQYAVKTGQLAMQGVISPLYLVNGIGRVFSRRGEGLIGFNYTLKGNAKTPVVSVNPLSALAPGVLRDVFRAPTPQVPTQSGTVPEDPAPTSRTEVETGGGNR